MKTLIEKSIKFIGIGHPDTKTIFNIESELEKSEMRYRPLQKISGRKLTVQFDYIESEIKKTGKVLITVIKSESENEIKEFILKILNDSITS